MAHMGFHVCLGRVNRQRKALSKVGKTQIMTREYEGFRFSFMLISQTLYE